MKPLVCDMCGGKLIIGAGGIATCESCGTQYTPDRMKEKAQEIKGTVSIDNSHMIGSYLEIAKTAKAAGNYEEAELYCNKIIEIDPADYEGWLMKGEAAAWQSSSEELRLEEGSVDMVKAFDNAPDEQKEYLKAEVKDEFAKLIAAVMTLFLDRFSAEPGKQKVGDYMQAIQSATRALNHFLVRTEDDEFPMSALTEAVAEKSDQAVMKAWDEIVWPDYIGSSNDKDDRPGKRRWRQFFERAECCTAVLQFALNCCEDDNVNNIPRYRNLIMINEEILGSGAWEYRKSSWGGRWHRVIKPSGEIRDDCRNRIAEYQKAIEKIKETAGIQASNFRTNKM